MEGANDRIAVCLAIAAFPALWGVGYLFHLIPFPDQFAWWCIPWVFNVVGIGLAGWIFLAAVMNWLYERYAE